MTETEMGVMLCKIQKQTVMVETEARDKKN